VDAELRVYNQIYEFISSALYARVFNASNVCFLYVKTKPAICAHRIRLRKRAGEESIHISYLGQIKKAYSDLFKNCLKNSPLFILDSSKIILG
jgi:deoxyadenosine/deoxycytidine kinase